MSVKTYCKYGYIPVSYYILETLEYWLGLFSCFDNFVLRSNVSANYMTVNSMRADWLIISKCRDEVVKAHSHTDSVMGVCTKCLLLIAKVLWAFAKNCIYFLQPLFMGCMVSAVTLKPIERGSKMNRKIEISNLYDFIFCSIQNFIAKTDNEDVFVAWSRESPVIAFPNKIVSCKSGD